MNRNLYIAIVGFGSIGKRHYKNLKKLGYKNIQTFDIGGAKPDYTQFDVAFICTPTHLHAKQSLLAAKAGCHIFIEKPLSHNMKGIDKLIRITREKKLITLVGCNMRFHPCLTYIRSYIRPNIRPNIRTGKLGKVYGISHEFGSYLPGWRKGSDYRKNFAAKRKWGGGIVLDDIHEFDLLFWLNNFAKVEKHSLIYDKVSNLQIETEDMAVASFKFKNKVIGSVRCDYLQKSYSRNCKLVGEKGNLEWDFNENVVWLRNDKGKKKLFEKKNFDFNAVYIDQLKYFFNCIQKKKKTFNDIKRAKEVLGYVIRNT